MYLLSSWWCFSIIYILLLFRWHHLFSLTSLIYSSVCKISSIFSNFFLKTSGKNRTNYSTRCVCEDLTVLAFFLSVQFGLFSVLLHSFTKPVHRKEVFLEPFADIPTAIFWGLGVNLDLSNQFEVPCLCQCEFSSADVWSIHIPLLDLLILLIEVSLCQPVFYWFSASFLSKLQIQ